jgi:NADH-quinone oxidoreductase subunit H
MSLGQMLAQLRSGAEAWCLSHRLPTVLVDLAGWVAGGVFVLAVITVVALVAVYLERKVAGYIQCRLGPMKVGPVGIFQTLMDSLKLLEKEDIVPRAADPYLHTLGPILFLTATIATFVVVPWEAGVTCGHWVDAEIGLLYVAALSGVGVLGIICGGWGSNNKWSLLGALRGAAQLISYEIPLLLAGLCVVLQAETLSLARIAEEQQAGLGHWFLWRPWLWLPAFLFVVAGVAEVNRVPFDIPEAESELVAGFHTEYTGMKFALYFLAEYAHLYMVGLLFAVLFLAGWASPWGPPRVAGEGFVWLNLKAWGFVLLAMWIRWTLPRLRVDQLMELAWKALIPAGFVALGIVSVVLMWL